jgi:hypothetical protein
VFETDLIARQVLRNCAISDARYAGLYSICGLALRLRDLYKWENGLEPWVENDPPEVIAWIGEKEDQWEQLAEKEFDDIIIFEHSYDPFDAEHINGLLEPHGLFYGAGYAQHLRPAFFLAVLEEKRQVSGHSVYSLGRELARDLLTLPALLQDDRIVLRKECTKLFLWNQMFFTKKSARPALRFALRQYGLQGDDPELLQRHMACISAAEMNTYLYHELGEIKDTTFDRALWKEMVAAFPHTPIELLLRTVKDILADTNRHGTLHHIVKEGKKASLAFYVAFLDGLKKELFPEIVHAFGEFVETGQWRVIEEAVSTGRRRASKCARGLSKAYLKGRENDDMGSAEGEIERRFLRPLGLGKQKRDPTLKNDGDIDA